MPLHRGSADNRFLRSSDPEATQKAGLLATTCPDPRRFGSLLLPEFRSDPDEGPLATGDLCGGRRLWRV